MTENEINTLDKAIEFCYEKSKNIKLKTEPQTFVNITKWLEEFKALKEKNVAKKITHEATFCTCPACLNVVDEFVKIGDIRIRVEFEHCHFCGQKLDWSEV